MNLQTKVTKVSLDLQPFSHVWYAHSLRYLITHLLKFFFPQCPLKLPTQLQVYFLPLLVYFSTSPPFFPHCPPSCLPQQSTDWMNCVALFGVCCVSLQWFQGERGRERIEAPIWVIKGYFHPCLSVGSCSKYRSGTTDANETCPSLLLLYIYLCNLFLEAARISDTLPPGPDSRFVFVYNSYNYSEQNFITFFLFLLQISVKSQ